MKSNIYLPKKINIGYQKRSDTYTQKLAYIIYTDDKGVLRKEASWNSWRDKTIETNEYENTPIEGFVLNKKAGGYSSGWNHRQTYCRVYDPRGFEFEINIENLLYILENTDSIKGKGLNGKFIYGWSGKDLILIPEGAPEYKDMEDFTKLQALSITTKDLKEGFVYQTKQKQLITYLGKLPIYQFKNDYDKICGKYTIVKSTKKFIFCTYNEQLRHNKFNMIDLTNLNSISRIYSEKPSEEYPFLMDEFYKLKESAKPLRFEWEKKEIEEYSTEPYLERNYDINGYFIKISDTEFKSVNIYLDYNIKWNNEDKSYTYINLGYKNYEDSGYIYTIKNNEYKRVEVYNRNNYGYNYKNNYNKIYTKEELDKKYPELYEVYVVTEKGKIKLTKY